jgi:hypothetical protein
VPSDTFHVNVEGLVTKFDKGEQINGQGEYIADKIVEKVVFRE